MSKFAAGTRILAITLIAVPLLQQLAGADDGFQPQARPAAQQNRRPAVRRSTATNYDRNAAVNTSLATPAAPVVLQRAKPEPTADPFVDETADSEPESDPEAPLPDGPYRPRFGCDELPSCNTCNQCGGNAGCCRCCQCGPPGRFWVRDEYLGFWTKGDSLPVLVTTSPAGTLPATTPVFGGNTVNGGYRSGNWIQAGMWLDCCRNWGLQADYFFLGQASTGFNQTSDGSPVLARPYTDATTGQPGQELVAYPGTVVGGVSVCDTTTFQSAGINLLHNLCCWKSCCNESDQGCGCCFQGQTCSRLDFITGFRYYNLGDNLGITENLTNISTTNSVPVGTMINVNDSFRTQNNFYGGTLGLTSTHYKNRWVYEGTAQVALGANNQRITINGSTTNSFPGQTTVVNPGGLYALSSNIGSYTHTNFAAIPQFSGRLGYRFTPRFTGFVGYTFIYWGQVARAGNQVNTTVNPNLLPNSGQSGGPAQPSFTLHETSFWAQGITLGGQLNF
jgi:Putative beta barrel porin-7 (BBP7)